MWIEFKTYQEEAIEKLKVVANDVIASTKEKSICIFKAPTGSGKTLMMAEMLRRLVESAEPSVELAFIWISVHKLHDQSLKKLQSYYMHYSAPLKCAYYRDLSDRVINSNEILFLNWSSINKKDNIFIRDNERNDNLSVVLERTKAAGKNLILIIDESHETAKSDLSKELINSMAPKLVYEVSATPQIGEFSNTVVIDLQDVQSSGMIKKEVVINTGLSGHIISKDESDKTADELILDLALKKRKELAQLYCNEGLNINPLMLIQVPNSVKGLSEKKDSILGVLKNYNITTDNGRLAIYLSGNENKINLTNIEMLDNEVEVMIFKQAIAVGWDCPRACILVMFREMKSVTFSIQTIGRIMRMPEQVHYKSEELNVGYIFTSLSEFSIAEDISESYLTIRESYRKDKIYEPIKLVSFHRKRYREETRLSPGFEEHFIKACEELNLRKNIDTDNYLIDFHIIANGSISNIDQEQSIVVGEDFFKKPYNLYELQSVFDHFISNNLSPYYPESRSVKRVATSIYKYFDKEYDMGKQKWSKVQAVVLANGNKQAFIDVINQAKEHYRLDVGKKKQEIIQNGAPWEVPAVRRYGKDSVAQTYKKSILDPYFNNDMDLEKKFIDYLENENQSPSVQWWFRNETTDTTDFAIPYEEDQVKKLFYVDFIVASKNGWIGLFDTKGGIYAKTAGPKAEHLAKYIEEQSLLGKKVYGGIVIMHQNSWRYNDSKKYKYNPDNLSAWKFLQFK